MSTRSRIDYTIVPAGALSGTISVPGDKSISHRALMLGAIAEGTTRISGFLNSEDTRATLQALQQMGVTIEYGDTKDKIIIQGVGLHGLKAPDNPLDLGNSGTSVRLMSGLLAGQTFDSELRGDASLMQRPMRRVTEPLQQMNADIRCSDQGTLPIVIHGGRSLRAISYKLPVASAQIKSSLLLAGLYASGKTCTEEPAVTRDHTERLLNYFGCPVEKTDGRICITAQPLLAKDITIPADISSAAFFMVAASIVQGSDLILRDVGVNPTRDAIIEILQTMGADISVRNQREDSAELIADIHVKYHPLNGITIAPQLVPRAIDEFPAILIAAAYAEGETRISGAGELRVKESDRIQSIAEGLHELGIKVETTDDGMVVQGGLPNAGTVNSYTDHRIAMAFAVAGMAANGPITIRDCANVQTSFPDFISRAQEIGTDIVATEVSNE